MRTVGAKHVGRQIALSDDEPARLEVLSDRAIGGRGQEQDERRRHHVMNEAQRRDFLAVQAAPDSVVSSRTMTFRPFLPGMLAATNPLMPAPTMR
jgi:hypothetical protein